MRRTVNILYRTSANCDDIRFLGAYLYESNAEIAMNLDKSERDARNAKEREYTILELRIEDESESNAPDQKADQ